MGQHFYSFSGLNDGVPDFVTDSSIPAGWEFRGGPTLGVRTVISNSWAWLFLPVEDEGSSVELLLKGARRRVAHTESIYGLGVFANSTGTIGQGCFAMFNSSASYNSMKTGAIVRDEFSTVASSASFLDNSKDADRLALDTWSYMRFRINAGRAQARAWWEGQSEPGSWSIDGAYTHLPGRGKMGVVLQGYGNLAEIAWVGVGTEGEAAPSSPVNYVAGTLRTPSNALAAGYVARCYRRSTGQLLGEAITDSNGQFEIPIGTTDDVTIVGIDQLGDSWNAPAKDLILPADY